MKLVYVHSENNVEVLTEIVSNHSMSVEDLLNLTEFDLDAWADGEDYDYNSLKVQE